MPTELAIAIVTVFIAVAVASGAVASLVLTRAAPERRRLREMKGEAPAGLVLDNRRLMDTLGPLTERLAAIVPKSPRQLSVLRRRLTTAGLRDLSAAIWFSAAKLVLPVVLGGSVFLIFGGSVFLIFGVVRGWIAIAAAAVAGFLAPDFWLGRKTRLRQKAIRNGLPDALDLFIVCLEAGSSLDQAILKASEELEIAHPAVADELRLITTEIRAGKPRLEALKNFADRTRVADVRSLVATLVQTDRFGTSVGQALRTHAETSRTKRRQRAEERAAKMGIKLVFPLVFFLFPALYVVILGPAAIRIIRVFVGLQGTIQ